MSPSTLAEVADGYVNDLLAAMPSLRAQADRFDGKAQRMRTAAAHAIAGVLTYSQQRGELDLAIGFLEELELARHRRRILADVDALRARRATIPVRAVDELVEQRAAVSLRARLDELDGARRRAGLPPLPR